MYTVSDLTGALHGHVFAVVIVVAVGLMGLVVIPRLGTFCIWRGLGRCASSPSAPHRLHRSFNRARDDACQTSSKIPLFLFAALRPRASREGHVLLQRHAKPMQSAEIKEMLACHVARPRAARARAGTAGPQYRRTKTIDQHLELGPGRKRGGEK